MTRIIPARIEDGRIVPEEALPDPSTITHLSIRVERAPSPGEVEGRPEAWARPRGPVEGVGSPTRPGEAPRGGDAR